MSRRRRSRALSPHAPASPPPPAAGPGRASRRVLAALALVVALAYANSFPAGFTLDNRPQILEDARIRAVDAGNLRAIFTEDYWWPVTVSGLYRPLTTLSYMLDYAVLGSGARPAGYHALNLLLHLANAVLAWRLARLLLGDDTAAGFAAALFAVHPVATEAVTNIVGRADLLATASVLGGLLIHARRAAAPAPRRGPWTLALSATFLGGLLSKESAAALPAVILCWDLTAAEPMRATSLGDLAARAGRSLRRMAVPLGVPLVIVAAARARIFAHLPSPELAYWDNPLVRAGFWTARATALNVVGQYLGLLVWPRTLSCDYSYDQVPVVDWARLGPSDLAALAALAALGLGALLAWRSHRRGGRAVPFYLLFALVTFLPASNLIVLVGSVKAERFLYTPLVAFGALATLAVCGMVRRVGGKPPAAWLVLGVMIAAALVRTVVRNEDWRDDEHLWSAAVAASPRSFKARLWRAADLERRFPDGSHLDDSIADAALAAQIAPGNPHALLQLARFYRRKGDRVAQTSGPAAAREWYVRSETVLESALPLDRAFNEESRRKELARGRPAAEIHDVGNPEIYLDLAETLILLERYPEAERHLDRMRELAPGNPDLYLQRATLDARTGRADAAATALLESLLLDGRRADTRERIVAFYEARPEAACAVSRASGAPKLSLACPAVHRHLCAAYADLAGALAWSGPPGLAERTRAGAAQAGCAEAAPPQK